MAFCSILSTSPNSLEAIEEACRQAAETFKDKPDLAVLFFSPHHTQSAGEICEIVNERLSPSNLIGCPGESIVSNDQEIEEGPALTLWLGKWQKPVRITPFHLHLEQTSEGISLLGWPDELVEQKSDSTCVLLLGDPFTFPVNVFLEKVNAEHRGVRVVGGMASGGRQPGQNVLLLGKQGLDHGAVGVLLDGAVVRAIVSQGC